MKIMVTGGSGFIAQHYIKAIEQKGHECIIYDLPKNDILDMVALRLAAKDVNMIIHFAAMADVTVCINKQRQTLETNVTGTFNVGTVCADYKIPMINISTCCVYGNSLDYDETEDYTKPQAKEPYAVSKVAAEAIVEGIPNLDYAHIRVGTVYGVGMREALFTYIALDRVRNEEKIYVDGDGEQTRQLIYIDDLVDGMVRITERFKDVKGNAFNLCGYEKISAMDTVRAAEQIVGKKAIIEHRDQRYGQTFKENISVEKAKDYLGWEPKVNFIDGMTLTYKEDPRFK